MRHAISVALSGVLAVSPVLGSVGLSGSTAAVAQDASAQNTLVKKNHVFGDTYSACRVQNDAEFQAQLQRLIKASLERGLAKVDYSRFVTIQWRADDVDALIDGQVDKAIKQVKSESSWKDLITSIGSKSKATELAQAVADRAYQSNTFKAAVEQVAHGVAKQVGGELEFATEDAAKPALQCVQAFLGPRYGSAVAKFVGQDTRSQFDPTNVGAAAQVGTGDLVINSGEAIAGAVILLVRRSMARMARRVGQRVVGVVLGRVVALVAGGIGVVLIAKDLWDFRNGVLPIIESEMKSAETKGKIRDEISSALSTQMGEHVDDVAEQTAQRIVGIWHGFRKAHTKVVDLSERHAGFKDFMESVGRSDIPRVDQMVGLVLAEEGENGVLKRVRDGTLDRAVKKLDEAGVDIALQTRSIDTAFSWADLAGNQLDSVVEFEIYRSSKPDDFTSGSLKRLLDVSDKVAIVKMTGLPASVRATLLDFEAGALRKLGRRLDGDELGALAKYMNGMQADARSRLVQIAKQSPEKFRPLAPKSVQTALLASADQNAALDFMLRAPSMFGFTNIWSDSQQVLKGDISPVLLWHKEPAVVTVAGAVLAFVLLIFYRLLFGRRPKVIVQRRAD